MITGLHAMIYSRNADAVKAFLRDAGLRSVDAGEGWPIFAAPPTEMAVHPTGEESSHELYFICDDINATIGELAKHGVNATPVQDRGWGLVTTLTLPGGEEIGLYEAKYPSPFTTSSR